MSAAPRIDPRVTHGGNLDAVMRHVDADDLRALLDAHQGDARASEQFRAAERDAAYDAREEGGDT